MLQTHNNSSGFRIFHYLKTGKSLLHEVIEQEHINQFGNFLIKDGTNNLGELLGLNIALLIAKKKNIKEIYGDSELVIKYWSKGRYNKLPERTIRRIKKVAEQKLLQSTGVCQCFAKLQSLA